MFTAAVVATTLHLICPSPFDTAFVDVETERGYWRIADGFETIEGYGTKITSAKGVQTFLLPFYDGVHYRLRSLEICIVHERDQSATWCGTCEELPGKG